MDSLGGTENDERENFHEMSGDNGNVLSRLVLKRAEEVWTKAPVVDRDAFCVSVDPVYSTYHSWRSQALAVATPRLTFVALRPLAMLCVDSYSNVNKERLKVSGYPCYHNSPQEVQTA